MSLEGRRILTKPTEKRTESEIYYVCIYIVYIVEESFSIAVIQFGFIYVSK